MSSSADSFPIVGIGASAGGIKALESFFRAMPDAPGMAFVIVTHLNPERESRLHEVIGRFTRMPVETARDGASLERDRVYVAPSNAVLGVAGALLSVREPEGGRRQQAPIDVFFSALAQAHEEMAVGILLSGGGTDGTLGIKAIKAHGGLTMAQTADHSPPQEESMPTSAIMSGLVDLALPVDEMPAKLIATLKEPVRIDGAAAAAASEISADGDLREVRQAIHAILREQSGHDFSGYKTRTFMRRVQRRMRVRQAASIAAYLDLLRSDVHEVSLLFRDLLISVTSFFRDEAAFEALVGKAVPGLFDGRDADGTVRVWVPGCATGEEVYSIAMILREHMDTLPAPPRVQIFATDIDGPALAVARTGRYPEALLEGVSPARRERFFSPAGETRIVAKELRDLCVFSAHSIIRDPPFSRMDLVSCRNLLIYFGPEIQDDVIPLFHYALRPGGFLFLGVSENIGRFEELFASVDRKHRLFRSRARVATAPHRVMAERPHRDRPASTGERRRTGAAALQLRQRVETQVLEQFAPAHVVVDRDGEVVYYSARTGKYLEAAVGAPSRQIFAIARKGLRVELRSALHHAVATGQKAVRRRVQIETDAGVQLIDLTVEPVASAESGEALFLVVFGDVAQASGQEGSAESAPIAADEAVSLLERDLGDVRERLQSTVREYEGALEELRLSNEELVSVNEEFQSTNEELEVSKEELQSVNEELQTLNLELTSSIQQADEANSDLRNLFESTQIATVFLDRDLVIRSYTPAIAEIFPLVPGDRGRTLTDFATRLDYPAFREDIATVLKDGDLVRRPVRSRDGEASYLARLSPYRDAENEVRGIVATFVDVTDLVRAEERQRVLIAELNHRVRNMLTVVIGIARQTLAGAGTPKAGMEAFIARLHAMARAFGLLSREGWTEVSAEELFRMEFAPYGLERVAFDGPSVMLKPKAALSLSMVIHELATNAAKYGALSHDDGRISLAWSGGVGKAPLDLFWQEQGGPEAAEPDRFGFGLKLVKREVEYGLRGSAELTFAPSGLRAHMVVPASAEPESDD